MNFYESQKFPLRQIAVALLVPPSIMTLLLLWQVVLGHHWQGQSLSNDEVIGWTIFLWLLYFRLITVRMVTKVDQGKLIVRLRGIWRSRRIPLAHIQSAAAITFDPVRDYGGYGIRSGPAGKAWIASRNHGVHLILANGDALVIGSQRPDELVEALRN
jgi:hypothetical protein